jgi:hypothetical protein
MQSQSNSRSLRDDEQKCKGKNGRLQVPCPSTAFRVGMTNKNAKAKEEAYPLRDDSHK